MCCREARLVASLRMTVSLTGSVCCTWILLTDAFVLVLFLCSTRTRKCENGTNRNQTGAARASMCEKQTEVKEKGETCRTAAELCPLLLLLLMNPNRNTSQRGCWSWHLLWGGGHLQRSRDAIITAGDTLSNDAGHLLCRSTNKACRVYLWVSQSDFKPNFTKDLHQTPIIFSFLPPQTEKKKKKDKDFMAKWNEPLLTGYFPVRSLLAASRFSLWIRQRRSEQSRERWRV